MKKFVRVMFGTKSGAKRDLELKINEVNISDFWNPEAERGEETGGFNYATEDSILRWLHRGDTIYDVEIPEDAEVIERQTSTIVYRTNKIILKNPRKIDDDMAFYFYQISNIPEKSYYKAMAVVGIMNYRKTAYAILNDKVNKENIDVVLEEWNDFISHGGKFTMEEQNDLVKEINKKLNDIKNKKEV